MKNIKILALAIVSILVVTINGSSLVLAADPPVDCSNPKTAAEAIRCGSCNASGQEAANCMPGNAGRSLEDTIHNVINILSVIVGIVAVVMIIVAGFRFITSAGNEQTVASARRTLLYSVVGLVVVALAQVIVQFTLNEVTKTSDNSSSTPPPTSQPSVTPNGRGVGGGQNP